MLDALNVGDAHQLRGPAEIGAHSRRSNPRDRSAATHQPSREGGLSRLHFGRIRFAGQHGLIEQQSAVGGNDVTERNLNDIAGNKVSRRSVAPGAVAFDARRQRQALLEKRQGGARLS